MRISPGIINQRVNQFQFSFCLSGYLTREQNTPVSTTMNVKKLVSRIYSSLSGYCWVRGIIVNFHNTFWAMVNCYDVDLVFLLSHCTEDLPITKYISSFQVDHTVGNTPIIYWDQVGTQLQGVNCQDK